MYSLVIILITCILLASTKFISIHSHEVIEEILCDLIVTAHH